METETFVKNNLMLRDQYDDLIEKSNFPREELARWKRTFYFYELSRELIVNLLGERRFERNVANEIPPGVSTANGSQRALLNILHLMQNDDGEKFPPWVSVPAEKKKTMVEGLGEWLESVVSARDLHLTEWTDLLEGGEEGLQLARKAVALKDDSVWLLANFQLSKIDDWDRQFESWKNKTLKKLGKSQKRPRKTKSEATPYWLDHLSRLRVLRIADWNQCKADDLLTQWNLVHLRPGRLNQWSISVTKVEEQIKRYFAVNANFRQKRIET